MAKNLTAEEQNATMSAERAFLTKFLESALTGDFPKLKSLVEDYTRDNIEMSASETVTQFKDGKRRTALHFACQSSPSNSTDEDDIVSRLILSKWLPSETVQSLIRLKDEDGLTPIMLAARHQDRTLAERRVLALLKAASSPEASQSKKYNKLGLARSRAGATALHYAASAGATATTIRALYEAGQVALQTSSQQGGTPLHWAAAASQENAETLATLIEVGANINAHVPAPVDSMSQLTPPPLILAAAAGNDANCKTMIKAAADRAIDLAPSLDFLLPGSVTLLHIVADMNLVGTLALLFERQAEGMEKRLEMKNGEGLKPLELAAKEGHLGCILLLLPGDDKTEERAKAYMEEFQRTNKGGSTPPKNGTAEVKKPKDEKSEDPQEAAARKKALEVSALVYEDEEAKKTEALGLKAKGNAHFGKKEWDLAIELYTRAIEVYAKDATFYSNRSACYLNAGKASEALFDAIIARTLNPNWSKACYRMAMARLELGRYEDAALSAWEGLQQDQENEELKSLLQKCVKKGRKDFLQQNQQRA